MAVNIEMGERLLEGANQLGEEAKQFTQNTKDVKKAAIAASFWACSKPCTIIFGGLAIFLLYFILK